MSIVQRFCKYTLSRTDMQRINGRIDTTQW